MSDFENTIKDLKSNGYQINLEDIMNVLESKEVNQRSAISVGGMLFKNSQAVYNYLNKNGGFINGTCETYLVFVSSNVPIVNEDGKLEFKKF